MFLQLGVQRLKDHQVRVLLSSELVVRLAHKSMKGRNGCLWSFDPSGRQSVRRSERNLVTAKPGSIAPVSFSASLEDYFKLLVSEQILEIIVHHTNDMLSIPVTQVILAH